VTRCAGRSPVLMYHAVGRVTEDPFGLFVTPERFRRQIAALERLGLRGVSFGDLGDAIARGRADGLVGLTFDDGYRDLLRFVVPVLQRHGFTATFFAVSGMLGGDNVWDPPPRRELMTEEDLRELAARGYEVGSHSVSHVRLAGLDPEALRHEVEGSRTMLARVVGDKPRSFCYPYGSVDAEAVRAVVDAGYSYACAVGRVADLPTRFAMPRIGVAERDRGPRFIARIFLKGR
jgi:peptidoglycan/xylan/chitin deacetylase (PgdA/CDA1 family)